MSQPKAGPVIDFAFGVFEFLGTRENRPNSEPVPKTLLVLSAWIAHFGRKIQPPAGKFSIGSGSSAFGRRIGVRVLVCRGRGSRNKRCKRNWTTTPPRENYWSKLTRRRRFTNA